MICSRVLFVAAAAAIAIAGTPPPAHAAASHVALVIGNGTYSSLPALPGCLLSAHAVAAALRGAGFLAASDSARGLDHGAWIPLRLMFPDAEVPVVPLSIQVGRGPGHHLAVGRALAPLAARGFLVLGSGNLTHNLGDFQGLHRDAGPIPPYVREFADWIWQRIEAADVPSLLDYRRLAPDAVRAHPQEDHLLPLYVALGAAAGRSAPERVHAGVDNYVLAMDAFAFH